MASETYAFDDFLLKPAAGELLRGGTPIHLAPTNFQLLVLMVRSGGSLLEKAALMDAVWNDREVSEASLSRAIATIRQALGDDAHAPRYIATVPWRGYRFIAPVRVVPGASVPRTVAILIHGTGHFPVRSSGCLIGRADDCDVLIPAATVSRHHARLSFDGSDLILEDLDSRNGTFIADRQIKGAAPLRDGDQIRLGAEVMSCRMTTFSETEPLVS